MSGDDLLGSVRQYLASRFMFVDDEWLSGCIEYLSEDPSKHYTTTDIKKLAEEQWLLNDLKDICPGSLPSHLKSHKKIVLPGPYVVQINAVLDIGTPAYQQYLKLKKVNQENIEATTNFEDRIRNNRMLKLYMTDGVQDISGLEYKPMRNLSSEITPGCKALLKGPVECRRGVVLLTESNLELIGGEVQEMANTNCLSYLLSSRLSLPVPEPCRDSNRVTTFQHNQAETTQRQAEIPRSSTETLSAWQPDFSDVESSVPETRTSETESSKPVARVTSLQVASSFTDDDIDIEQLAALEEELTKNSSSDATSIQSSVKQDPIKRPSTEPYKNPKKLKMSNSVDDYPTEADLIMEEEYLRELDELEKCRRLDNSESKSENSTTTAPSKNLETQLDKSTKNNLENFELEPDNLNKGDMNFQLKFSPEPFTYIKLINDLPKCDRQGKVFKIKGQIIKLLSKLSVGKDGWSLRCTLVDGTGTLDVDFTSDVLSKLVGYTPQEMNHLKKQMATNPELKEKAVNALYKAKNALQALYCIIELTFSDTVKITRLIPFGEEHLKSLEARNSHLDRKNSLCFTPQDPVKRFRGSSLQLSTPKWQ